MVVPFSNRFYILANVENGSRPPCSSSKITINIKDLHVTSHAKFAKALADEPKRIKVLSDGADVIMELDVEQILNSVAKPALSDATINAVGVRILAK